MTGADRDPRDRPTTVIHLITTLAQGGAERVLSQVVPRPAEQPRERHVVVSLVAGGMFADELVAAGVDVRDLGMRPGRDLARGALRLAALLRELRPHTVISWMYHASLLDLLARPLAGPGRRARMVWMVRGSLEAIAAMPLHTRATVRILAFASGRPEAIGINSTAGRKQHAEAGFSPRRWVHIPNGCDTDRFSPDPDVRARMRDRLGIAADELAIAFVGRNHQEKGLDLLLGCLPRLEDLDRRTVVVLAGSGTDEILATHGARSRVIALGERSDVADLLRASDALVLPSRSEGTPNAVIEAMATAIPCVVTDVGDTADLVGETGIIVAMPTIEKLTKGLRELAATDPAERRRLGAAARERVITRHSPATAREAYRSLWHKDLR